MALTSAQQNKIVQLLGFGSKVLDAGSVIYDKVLVDRLGNLTAAGEALAVQYLVQIAAIETQMAGAPSRLTAKKVGDIDINNQELHMLRRERKVIAKEIAALLSLPYLGSGSVNVAMVV